MTVGSPTAEYAAPPAGATLIARLKDVLEESARSDPGTASVEVIETHISWVLLTPTHAYKIKKPVDLGFLDFTSLSKRRAACEDELRLNKRLAPDLYLDVLPITGTPEAPILGGDGPPIEYAVRMRAFAQGALLSQLIKEGDLRKETIDALASTLARFHRFIPVASPQSGRGDPVDILEAALENLVALRKGLGDSTQLQGLERWTRAEYDQRRPALLERRQTGAIRECHGDLHLGNIALTGGEITIFDCIEFNESMRWIDVISEAAFTVMDLADRGRPDLAYRFLNAYLEDTGDYAGLQVLGFYLVYRALVRAKIAALRTVQLAPGPGHDASRADAAHHIRLAERLAYDRRPAIVLMHGLSGSGKTTCSQSVLEGIGAIRLRSDVERKRMAGLARHARSGSDLVGGLYSPDASEKVYAFLLEMTGHGLDAGWTVIVDAAFLRAEQRIPFESFARTAGHPLLILDCSARIETLRMRIAQRQNAGADASEATLAVLQEQLATSEALSLEEERFTLHLDMESESVATRDWCDVKERLERSNPPAAASKAR